MTHFKDAALRLSFYGVDYLVLTALVAVVCLLPLPLEGKESASGPALNGPAKSSVPPEYGRVIFRINENSAKQLFIIGTAHRDGITRSNGDKTTKAQAEAYKIGEWLVHHEDLDLLLPEGFFQRENMKSGEALPSKISVSSDQRSSRPFDITAIEAQLSAGTVYVNSEMLLSRHFLLKLRQVEDRGLYDSVKERLLKLASGSSAYEAMCLQSELNYLQEMRTAAMLQNIPEIIIRELRNGVIKNSKAMVTIGLSHIPEVLEFIRQNRIAIDCPLYTSLPNGNYRAELNLLKEGFGVTIIVPATLANDRDVLRKTGMDKIITDNHQVQANARPHNVGADHSGIEKAL